MCVYKRAPKSVGRISCCKSGCEPLTVRCGVVRAVVSGWAGAGAVEAEPCAACLIAPQFLVLPNYDPCVTPAKSSSKA